MYTKAQIFNLSLSALLLQRQVANPDTDPSNEAKVLSSNWQAAFESTLGEMDLDATSTYVPLELIVEDPTNLPREWEYAYKYPTNCLFFRRIRSCYAVDNKTTHIPKRVGIYNGQKVIFTRQEKAVAEIIASDIPLAALNGSAALALAMRLAWLSAPLIVGKGSGQLKQELASKYTVFKAEAQEIDRRENFSFESEATMSEFVEERLSGY